MLDVHPPHTPTHTWKDFLIHIATICVGLLIAVGLEQTVEAAHHRHQRHELEERLRIEAENNLNIVELNLGRLREQNGYIQKMIVALNTAPEAQGHINLDLSLFPQPEKAMYYSLTQPAQTAWTVAKTTGGIGLLPDDEAQVYSRLDYEADQLNIDLDFTRAQDAIVQLYQARRGMPPARARYLTLAERDDLLKAFSFASTQYYDMFGLQLNESGACRGVLHGARTVEEMYRFMIEEFKRVPNL
jgi:hypothetical protein